MAGLVAAGILLSLALPASAGAYVYWGNENGSTVGRAELDGSNVNQSFVTSTPDSGPCGVAVNDTHVFWANFGGGTIGRAELGNPATADQNFITGVTDPCGLALNDTHIFWATYSGDTIGRAELGNPGGANDSFITGADFPCGVAVNATHLFWANEDGGGGGGVGFGTIGRAELGNPASADQNFITATAGPDTCGVAVNESHIYWGDDNGTNVGRANLDGSDPNPSLITDAVSPCGLAVDALPDTTPPDTAITTGPKKKTKKKKATFEFTSSEPGASFECSLDGKSTFAPCTSPLTVKVRKGKHTFQVQATRPATPTPPRPPTPGR